MKNHQRWGLCDIGLLGAIGLLFASVEGCSTHGTYLGVVYDKGNCPVEVIVDEPNNRPCTTEDLPCVRVNTDSVSGICKNYSNGGLPPRYFCNCDAPSVID